MLIGSKWLMLISAAVAAVDNAAFAFTPSHHHHIRSIVKSSSYGHHPANVAIATIQNNHRTCDANRGSSSRLHSSQSTDDLQSNDDDLDKLTIPALKEHLKQLGLPVGGRKSDLIERLEGAVATANNEDDGELEIGALMI